MHAAEYQSDDVAVDSTDNPLSAPSAGGYRPTDWEPQGALPRQHSEPAARAPPVSGGGLPRATSERSAVTMAAVEDEDAV